MTPVSLVYAGNAGIFDGILISALSLAKQNPHMPLHLYILTMDLSEEDARYTPITEASCRYLESVLLRYTPEVRVTRLDVGALYIAHLAGSPNAETGYTPYALLRLLLHLLPVPEKVLYLDADTVVAGDIRPLWETDITGYEFAAALDYYGKIFMGYRYINTGVMLLNLAEIRRTGLFVRCLEALMRRRIFLPDQTAMNRLCRRKKLLPRCYNEQKRDGPDTVIRHFSKTIIWHPFFPFFYTKNIKPWQTERVKAEVTGRYNDLLDEYLTLRAAYKEEPHRVL